MILNEKIGVIYNVFDSEELLKQSIESIKSIVDYIVIVYQTSILLLK